MVAGERIARGEDTQPVSKDPTIVAFALFCCHVAGSMYEPVLLRIVAIAIFFENWKKQLLNPMSRVDRKTAYS